MSSGKSKKIFIELGAISIDGISLVVKGKI